MRTAITTSLREHAIAKLRDLDRYQPTTMSEVEIVRQWRGDLYELLDWTEEDDTTKPLRHAAHEARQARDLLTSWCKGHSIDVDDDPHMTDVFTTLQTVIDSIDDIRATITDRRQP